MKLKYIYLTDVHLKGVNPGKRKDIYYIAILKKLMEIGEVVKREDAKFIVIGGDLFDLPKVSNQLLGELAKIIKSWGVKVFVVPGNHDVYGQTISTLPHTSLGILERTGVVTILTRDVSPIYVGKANDPNFPLLAFTGQESYQEIDTGVNNDYEVEHGRADLQILIAHGMLLEKPFHPDVPCTLMGDVRTSADLIMTGHYHPDTFDTMVTNGLSNTGATRFIKPRAVSRLEATKHNIKHKPQYSIVEVNKDAGNVSFDVSFYDFDYAEEGSAVFDYEGQVEEKLYKSTLNSFKEKIQSVDLTNATDLPAMLKKIAQAEPDVTVEHIQTALRYLSEAEKTDSKKALDGYVALQQDVQIAKVVLVNFQSHECSEVEFTPDSLNALIGESDNGKTAILRGIEWVLYNEPKGNDFIKNDAKFAEVSIHMTNGNIITRRRTNSDTGHYEVYDSSTGKTEKYTKFGQSIPMEVFNAHQMPMVQLGKHMESINLSKQLEGPFMLSKSGSERASIIGKITKTDIVDESIAAISKNIVNAQRTIKSAESELEEVENQLKKYDHLPEEEVRLNEVKDILEKYELAKNRKDKLSSMLVDLNRIVVDSRVTELAIQKYDDFAKIAENITAIESEIRKYNNLLILNQQLNNVKQDIELTAGVLSNSADYEELAKEIADTESIMNRLTELKKCEVEYANINKSLSKGSKYISDIKMIEEDKINNIEASLKVLDELVEKRSAYEYYVGQLKKCDDALEQESAFILKQEEKMKELEKEYDGLLKEMGTCPTCGNPISEGFHCEL